MTRLTKIALIQMCSTAEITKNLRKAEQLIAETAAQGAQLVLLPENFAALGHANPLALAKQEWQTQTISHWLAEQAGKHNIYLLAGSLPLLRHAQDSKPYAASLLLDNHGELLARYDKLHLFDANVSDKHSSYRESDTFAAGNSCVVAGLKDAKLGMSICYDLRFALYYQALREAGAQLISVPSAFTQPTGQAHWQVLLQARAIETQCYILAPNQTGQHSANRASYGHSMIISPWGEILAHAGTDETVVIAECDLAYLQQVREKMPMAKQQRFTLADIAPQPRSFDE